MNTHTPKDNMKTPPRPRSPWTLKAFHDGKQDHVDPKDAEVGIEIVRGFLSSLITASKHPNQPRAREVLRERAALVHRMVAALRDRPQPPMPKVLPSHSHTAGRAQREAQLDSVKIDG